MVMEPQMFFWGLLGTFLSFAPQVWFSSIFPAMGWCTSVRKSDGNKRKGCFKSQPKQSTGSVFGLSMSLGGSGSTLRWILLCSPKRNTMTVTCCCANAKGVLQEHRDLSSTSFYSQPACALPASLVQTPHPSHRALHGGGKPRTAECMCVCYVLWWRRWWLWWRVAPTKWCSQAWNHLSSALKGLHGFLMMGPYLLCAKYTQWLHSF